MPFDSVLAFRRVADFFSEHIDFSSIQIVTNGLNASSDATEMGKRVAKRTESVNPGRQKPTDDSDALTNAKRLDAMSLSRQVNCVTHVSHNKCVRRADRRSSKHLTTTLSSSTCCRLQRSCFAALPTIAAKIQVGTGSACNHVAGEVEFNLVEFEGDAQMSERKQTNSATDESNPVSESLKSKSDAGELSRRNFLGVSSTGLATAALASLAVNAQQRANIAKGEQDHSVSNPGPENKPTIQASLRVGYAERKLLLKREMPSFCMRK
jgi:hypothetical protein